MTDAGTPLVRWSRAGNVAVVEILRREIQERGAAVALGKQLRSLLVSGEKLLLLDFGRIRVMSSAAFGALLIFSKEVEAANGVLADLFDGTRRAVRGRHLRAGPFHPRP